MAITLKKIAKESGFNQTTVSLVLNNHPNANKFTSETRRKIREVAVHLGYHPNAAARALVTQQTNNIGLVIPDNVEGQWKNPFYSSFLNGITRTCLKLGYNVLPFCCNMDNIGEFVFPRGIVGRNIDGLLLCSTINPKIMEQFDRLNMPYARIGIAVKTSDAKYQAVFSPDIVGGLKLAIEYLLRYNHMRIAIMDTNSPSSSAIGKQLDIAVAESHLANRVQLKHIYTTDNRCDASSAKIFLATYFNIPEKERPTALITNPQACLGVIKEIGQYNMRCPDDLSLISFYDYDIFDYISPRMTAISFDNEGIAAYATEQLIKKIKQKNIVGAIESKNDFPISINIRNSCSSISHNINFNSKGGL